MPALPAAVVVLRFDSAEASRLHTKRYFTNSTGQFATIATR
jgi:hypothetical protein